MLGQIKGVVIGLEGQSLLVEAGSLGFLVAVADGTFFQKGAPVELQVHVHWNQENGPTLYGFRTAMEKKIFLLIICKFLYNNCLFIGNFKKAVLFKEIIVDCLCCFSGHVEITLNKFKSFFFRLVRF